MNYKLHPDAFNSDTFLQEMFISLVKSYEPEYIIETGTYHGVTTKFLNEFNLPVLTTEINKDFFDIAANNLKDCLNVTMCLEDSVSALEKKLTLFFNKKVLAFLDSHWLSDDVLERELIFFKKLEIPPVLLIHDFYVPGKDFGYDVYNQKRYDYETYKPYFDNLYSENNYTHSYNEQATGSRRGIILLQPK